ncbi:MAG: hypothetical protein ABIM77_08165 [candidate division WOR-3 bacterium]
MPKRGPVQNEELLGGISYGKLGVNEIYFRVPLLMLPRRTGVDASATGVKISELRIPFSAKHVKRMALRSEVTSITDGVTFRVGVYNVTAGAYVIYRDYTATGENEDAITAGFPADGNLLELRGECTVAAAGGTVDINYLLAYVEYGVS